MHMFGYQCQETGDGKPCTHGGQCGKSGEAASLQDFVIYVLKAIGIVNDALINGGGRSIARWGCSSAARSSRP